MMKKIVTTIKDSPFILPALIFLTALGLIHILFPIVGDDTFFRSVTQERDFFEYILSRYNTWTSRVLIESVMWVISLSWRFWIISNITIFGLLYYFLVKVFSDKPDRKTCWLCVFFILMYPLPHMATAGYMATTLNFLWPLTFGVMAGYGMKKSLLDQKIYIWEYPIYLGALLFASNLEQMNVFLLGLLLVLLSYSVAVKKKMNYYLFAQCLIVVAMLIFILRAPGPVNRYFWETMNWFPDYAMLGILERIQLGYSFVLSHFIFNPNLIFTVFCLLLYIAVHLQHTDKFYRVIAAIPLGSSVIFGFGAGQIIPHVTALSSFGHNPTQVVNVINFHMPHFYIPIVLLGFIILCVLAALYLAFKDDKWKAWLCITTLLLGLGSAIVMGFSPTVWASGFRTFIFTYFAFIACAILLYRKICAVSFKFESLLFALLCFLGMSSYFRYLATLIMR